LKDEKMATYENEQILKQEGDVYLSKGVLETLGKIALRPGYLVLTNRRLIYVAPHKEFTMLFFGGGELGHRFFARGKLSLEEVEKLLRETKDAISIPLENIKNVEYKGAEHLKLKLQKIIVTYIHQGIERKVEFEFRHWFSKKNWVDAINSAIKNLSF
jgi:hypothetical protein